MKTIHTLFFILLITLTCGVQAAGVGERVRAQMAAGDRDAAEKERDSSRKPDQVLEFLGVEEGMTAIDIIAAGGYYTEMLSAAVGDSGKVYSQNSAGILARRDGQYQKVMDTRLANDRLANVEMLVSEPAALGLDGQADFVLTALNLHDIWIRGGESGATGLLKAIHSALKDGGILGVIDHVGLNDESDKKTHRMRQALAEKLLRDAGFSIEASSDILSNPADDHTINVFDESLGRNTDRFIIKAVKS
jgi:predicted methyltransferase